MRFIISEIKEIIKNNPEHYETLREQRADLKDLKEMIKTKLVALEKTIRNSAEEEQKLNDAQKVAILQMGSELDELLAKQKRLENSIIWGKINLNIPFPESELNAVISSLKSSEDFES